MGKGVVSWNIFFKIVWHSDGTYVSVQMLELQALPTSF